MKTNYEIYENNGGALLMCILDDSGNCTRIFENWEFGPAGILSDAIRELEDDPTAYNMWDGDLIERLVEVEGMDTTALDLYDEGLGDLVADSTGYRNEYAGYAAKKALNMAG